MKLCLFNFLNFLLEYYDEDCELVAEHEARI